MYNFGMETDLRIETRFKNAAMWRAMVREFTTVAEGLRHRGPLGYQTALSKASGIPTPEIAKLLNLRASPYLKNGDPRLNTIRIAEALGEPIETLFPRSLYQLALPKCIVREAHSEEILSLQEARKLQPLFPVNLDTNLERAELTARVEHSMQNLPPNVRECLVLYFGLEGEDEHTIHEIAAIRKVTESRVREIVNRGLRMMRHPCRSSLLKAYREGEPWPQPELLPLPTPHVVDWVAVDIFPCTYSGRGPAPQFPVKG